MKSEKNLATWKYRLYRARGRLYNLLLDTIDRLRGRCANAPVWPLDAGGYHFWRCGLRRRHSGPCRSGYYFWGPGGSIYDPDGPWAGSVESVALPHAPAAARA